MRYWTPTFFYVVLFVWANEAAAIQRIGVFIGNNTGLKSEQPLKYAEADARKLQRTMTRLGSFQKERTYLLQGASIQRVRQSLQEVQGRVKEVKLSGEKSLVFLYYSGHGGSEALHLNHHKLTRKALHDLFNDIEADLKIMVLDACESGDLLRSKGGEVIDNHTIETFDSLDNQGSVIISSSASGELSQESETYRGAVFTYHLEQGLRGVADGNGNSEVTLWEAFQYASTATRLENIGGAVGRQNPSFDFDVSGQSDLILTSFHKLSSRITMVRFPPVVLEVFDASNMALEARIHVGNTESVGIHLPSKEYLLAYETAQQLKVARVSLSWRGQLELNPANFKTYDRADVRRKGGRIVGWHDQLLGLRFASGERAGVPSIPFIGLQWVRKGYYWQHHVNLGWGRKRISVDNAATLSNQYLSSEYTLYRSLGRIYRVQLLLGAQINFTKLFQKLTDERFQNQTGSVSPIAELEHKSSANIYAIGVPAALDFSLPWMLSLFTGYYLGEETFRNSEGGRQFTLRHNPFFSMGYRF